MEGNHTEQNTASLSPGIFKLQLLLQIPLATLRQSAMYADQLSCLFLAGLLTGFTLMQRQDSVQDPSSVEKVV